MREREGIIITNVRKFKHFVYLKCKELLVKHRVDLGVEKADFPMDN